MRLVVVMMQVRGGYRLRKTPSLQRRRGQGNDVQNSSRKNSLKRRKKRDCVILIYRNPRAYHCSGRLLMVILEAAQTRSSPKCRWLLRVLYFRGGQRKFWLATLQLACYIATVTNIQRIKIDCATCNHTGELTLLRHTLARRRCQYPRRRSAKCLRKKGLNIAGFRSGKKEKAATT